MNGVYIHIPFCKSKCPYCDFYSYRCDDFQKECYVNAIIDEITTGRRASDFFKKPFTADTLYLGGGTPSVLTGEQILKIVDTAKKEYQLPENAEITIECNPSSDIEALIPYFKKAGINRVSLGMQSAVTEERRQLGRSADKERVLQAINLLKENGINNISLDIMLGVPSQTMESLEETLKFAVGCKVTHISAYILKIEEGTFFHKNQNRFNFPDENTVCELYLRCCNFLEKNGYSHYEISNFALPGSESRHNTKYWELENYLGIGAAAHSFIDGKRFYFESNSESFINGNKAIYDCDGGDYEEYIMLHLRLKTGLSISKLARIYGSKCTEKIIKKAPLLKEQGFIKFDCDNLSLTNKGFLLSNAIIAELI